MGTAIVILLNLIAWAFAYSAGVNFERKNKDAAVAGHVLALLMLSCAILVGRFM